MNTPGSTTEDVVGPSDRSFGLTFSAIFAIVGLAPLWRGGPVRGWAIGAAAALCVVALVRPGVLAVPNRLWLRLGLLMHRVVNPVVMAALFYLAVTPFGLVMRWLGKGLAPQLRPDGEARTYWVTREAASRMDQQF